jgi:acyl-homoserine-lactone acylase
MSSRFKFKSLLIVPGMLLTCSTLPGRAVAQATIYRDSYGLPSIEAKRLPDAMRGLGYAMATDNAELMVTNYRQARGHMAEIEGKSQLLMDGFLQSLGLEEEAQKKAASLTGDQKANIEAFCAGANRAIAEQKGKLPAWVNEYPVTPTDVLALAQLVNVAFPLQDAAGQLFAGIGSNQFAVSGKRTASGHAIVSADPHLTWNGVLAWYEYSLYSAGIKFHGVTLNGLPFGAMGHTDHVAWSMTNNDPALYTIYSVTTSSEHPGQYNYHGEWKNFETVKIALKYRENGELKVSQQSFRRTAWGPMSPFKAAAVRLGPVGAWDQLDQMLAMAKSKNIAEFRKAISARGMSMWNIVYGDTEGHIAYQYNARLARRNPTYAWRKTVSGADPNTKWGDLLTLDELPHIEDPASGLLVNANSSPWLTPQGPGISETWPDYITTYGHTTRYDRLAQELNEDQKISVANAMTYATDVQVPGARKAILLMPRKLTPASQEYVDALAVLRGWNGQAAGHSLGVALYMQWMLAEKRALPLIRKAASGKEWTAEEIELLTSALVKAAAKTKALYGRLDIPWGEVHYSQRGDVKVPVSGLGYYAPGDSTATVAPNYGPMVNGKINCIGGSSFRMIVDLDPKGVHSYSILPYGESHTPGSQHYTDQMAMFGRGEYKDTLFGLNVIRKKAVSHITLSSESKSAR